MLLLLQFIQVVEYALATIDVKDIEDDKEIEGSIDEAPWTAVEAFSSAWLHQIERAAGAF